MNRIVLTYFTVFCLLSTVFLMGFARNIQAVGTDGGAIYIRADGNIDPLTAPISTVDNVTYTFTGNTSDSVVVQRSNIVIDGKRRTLQGSGSGNGFTLSDVNNVTIKNTIIVGFWYGVYLNSTSYNILTGNGAHCTITENNITNNGYGVGLYHSSDNHVFQNSITNNGDGIRLLRSSNNSISKNNIALNNSRGIYLYRSSDNCITRNNITANWWAGIWFDSFSSNNTFFRNSILGNDVGIIFSSHSSNNKIYQNDFNNTHQASVLFPDGSVNVLDDGYPIGGNYWSDYVGGDIYSGVYQNETGSDWIGDSPYIINQNNTDRYPLMQPFVSETEEVHIAYRNLLLRFDSANSQLEALNSTLNSLLKNMTDLQEKNDLLQTTMENMQKQINSLNNTCTSLQESINDLSLNLNQTRENLQSRISLLNSTCNSLSQSIMQLQLQLNSVNSTMQTRIDNLEGQNSALSSQLDIVLKAMYVLIGLTVILLATTIYFSTRKPKIKLKTK
jgi:parallel beta-helix repeat protein